MDDHGLVFVFDTSDGSLLGSWDAGDLDDPEGIATDGTDIWIVDEEAKEILRFSGAASRLSGSQDADFWFDLDDDHEHASGLTTDGTIFWSTDYYEDAVFVYDVSGAFLGSWELDDDNSSPKGITIDLGGGSDIWVVDRSDDEVYYYAGAATLRGGSQDATSSFDLAGDNGHGEGIARSAGTTPEPGDSVWLPTLDFEAASDGRPLQTGEIIAEQWASLGVHVTTHDPTNHPAMIFDSANPTGDDDDLGSTNEDFGGPGWGSGGGAGATGEKQCTPRKHPHYLWRWWTRATRPTTKALSFLRSTSR